MLFCLYSSARPLRPSIPYLKIEQNMQTQYRNPQQRQDGTLKQSPVRREEGDGGKGPCENSNFKQTSLFIAAIKRPCPVLLKTRPEANLRCFHQAAVIQSANPSPGQRWMYVHTQHRAPDDDFILFVRVPMLMPACRRAAVSFCHRWSSNGDRRGPARRGRYQ